MQYRIVYNNSAVQYISVQCAAARGHKQIATNAVFPAVQEIRSSGVQEIRSSGVQEIRRSGVFKSIQEARSIGV